MSYIIKRKINNTTYVYECTSYRNKEGKPRNKQRCLGKLDSDGVLISSKRKLPVQIVEVKTVSKKFILEPCKPKAKSYLNTNTQTIHGFNKARQPVLHELKHLV